MNWNWVYAVQSGLAIVNITGNNLPPLLEKQLIIFRTEYFWNVQRGRRIDTYTSGKRST